jgi:hypothetical protein
MGAAIVKHLSSCRFVRPTCSRNSFVRFIRMIPKIIIDNSMILCDALPCISESNHRRLPLLRHTSARHISPYFHGKRKRFRMNTYKSLSKQTTLSTIRMNTYKKPGGRVSSQLGSFWPVHKKETRPRRVRRERVKLPISRVVRSRSSLRAETLAGRMRK